jgi:poly(A) polymerase
MEKGDFRYLDVFSHMDLTYKSYKELLSGLILLDNVDLNILNKQIGSFTLKEYLGFACFVHDIGKYINVDDHAVAGAEIVEKKCLELKFPREAVNMVSTVVKYHQVPGCLFKISDEKLLLSKVYKFFNLSGSKAPFILITSFCDFYAEKIIHDPENEKKKYKKFIKKLFTLYNEYIDIIRNKWVDGDFVKEEANVKGKEIGILIEEVNELIFSGIIKNKEEAQKYIMTKYGG